jgi:DDE superfamily endonuclease
MLVDVSFPRRLTRAKLFVVSQWRVATYLGTALMDNLYAHQAVGVQGALARRGACLLFLPSYGPDLSPIESCPSKVKTSPHKAEARTRDVLDLASTHALSMVTETDTHGWFMHCRYAR